MNAKSFARSGVGAVPMNKTDDCSYTTPPDCTNPSPNTKLIHLHIFTTTLLSLQDARKIMHFERCSPVIGRTLMFGEVDKIKLGKTL